MIFVNIAFVESDFSKLRWEKDEYRLSLTNFVIERNYTIQTTRIVKVIDLILE